MSTVCGRTQLSDWRGMSSVSRVYVANGYEISDDLLRRRIEVLEKRYGGRARAHRAAIVIQRTYREYRLNRRWREMTLLPTQRYSLSPALEKQALIQSKAKYPMYSRDRTLNRYLPTTSLSAQLRADRAQLTGSSELLSRNKRAPPSPSPSSPNPNRSMIDSLMSPRLVQRRFPAVADRSPFSGGGGGGGGVTHVPCPPSACNVWIPRATIASGNLSNSNSLSRIEKNGGIKSDLDRPRIQSRYCTEQERKRQYRIALNFFNKNPERGVQLLTAWRFVDDSAESLANLLFGRRGLSKQMIGEYISTLHSTFHACVLKYFIGLIDVRGMEVDVALRKAMQYFFLPKEVEKIDKVIQEFAQHYAKCNPKETKRFRGGWDTIHMIAFAVIMLNTDLHSPNLKSSQRMQMDQFIHNLRGQDKMRGEMDGADIDRACLQGIYERVRVNEIRPGDDHVAQVARVDAAFVGRDKPRLTETQRRLVCYCRLQQVLDPLRKQSSGSHERDVFLFNDMLVIGKAINKRRSSSRTSYALKRWMPLLGASVHEFKSSPYEFGFTITPPAPDSHPIHFNARNYDDRCRFVADVIESIRESCQMEEVRLELEMERHMHLNDNQRDSGLPELDGSDSVLTRPGNTVISAAGLVPTFRRLSFNSLDSGVVEEACETNS
ncbi:hypothetical protein KIN20_003489 [Parelaphostrongylus tenuis]|uniref:SEC7 domain-containing protein n=1 Tax=Parelaphostrongylus tenuis TaxID=148309 RepID=A0AAD5MFR4_PARTN|nr:hypothetical protein KIN20_003489 [Parelaphostrongylus tenuis]